MKLNIWVLIVCLAGISLAACQAPLIRGGQGDGASLTINYTLPAGTSPAVTGSAPSGSRLLLPTFGKLKVTVTQGSATQKFERTLGSGSGSVEVQVVVNLSDPLTIEAQCWDVAGTTLVASSSATLTLAQIKSAPRLQMYFIPFEDPAAPFPVATLADGTTDLPVIPAGSSYFCRIKLSQGQEVAVSPPAPLSGESYYFQKPDGSRYLPALDAAGGYLLRAADLPAGSGDYLLSIYNPGPSVPVTGRLSLSIPAIGPAWLSTFVTAAPLNGPGTNSFLSVVTGTSGRIYAAGQTDDGAFNFGGTQINVASGVADSTANKHLNFLITCYDQTGAVSRVIASPGGTATMLNSLGVDSSGAVIGAGAIVTDTNTGRTLALGLGASNPRDPLGNTPSLLVLKYSAAGVIQWAQSMTGTPTNASVLTAVAVDPSDNIYVGGRLDGANIHTFADTTSITPKSTGNNLVIAKLSQTDGHVAWVTTNTFVTTGSSAVSGMAADSGGVWAIGWAQPGNTYTLGISASANFSPVNTNTQSPFIVKLNPTGGVIFTATTTAGTSVVSSFTAVAHDGGGNAYAVGAITGSGTLQFGAVGVNVNPAVSTNTNAVLVKFDASGTAVYARSLANSAGAGSSGFNAVTADAAGNVYASGFITGTAATVYDFGNGVRMHGIATGRNLVVVKYDPSGLAQWARSLTGGSSGTASEAMGIALSPDGSLNVAGYVTGSQPAWVDKGIKLAPTLTNGNQNPVLLHF